MKENCIDCLLRTDVDATPERLFLMTRYVPYRVVKSIGRSKCCFFEKIIEKLNGIVIYFDIKGFTTIVNSYITTGRDVDELKSTLSDYYSVIIERIRDYGGSVFQFAGDSILICFEKFDGESDENNFGRAFVTMLAAIETSDSYNSIVEKMAGFSLNPKIGIGKGEFFQLILGGGDQYLTPVLTGNAVAQAIHMEEMCEKPEIVLSPMAYEAALSSGLEDYFEEKNGVYHLVKTPEDFVNKVEPPDYVDMESLYENPRFYNRCNSFISPTLIHQVKNDVQGFSGEYRTVTCCMVRFDGVFKGTPTEETIEKDYNNLNDVYTSSIKIADQFDSYCGKPDLSDKGTVFPVFFGTHGAFENKEPTAILFASRLVTEMQKNHAGMTVCIGIATGDVYAGEFGANMRKDFTIVGNTINYAARLMMKAADAGDFEIFIDKRTASKCKNNFNLGKIDGLMLKGFSEPQTIYRFKTVRAGTEKNFYDIPIIGRDKELEMLSAIYEISRENKKRVVPIVGDIGIGKTYLVEKFIENELSKFQDVLTLHGKAYFYENKTPLFLWREIIKQITAIENGMEGEKLFLHIMNVFSLYLPDDKNWVAYFLNVLGYSFDENPATTEVSAAEKQKHVFQLIYKLMTNYAKERSLVIVLDDLQWADTLSLHLLEYMFTNQEEGSIFIIPISRKTETIERLFYLNNFNVMNLIKLDDESSSFIAKWLLDFEKPDEELVQKIITLAGGNPWYLEIIVESLVDSKTIVKDGADHYYLPKPLEKLKIPYTIHDLIMSQVGSLPFETQLICKNASVIGNSFSFTMLSKLLPDTIKHEIIRLSLDDLVFHGLIVCVDEAHGGYNFKDTTVRTVVYDSIVEALRRSLNRKMLNYFEEKFSDNLEKVARYLVYYAHEAKEDELVEKYSQMIPAKK